MIRIPRPDERSERERDEIILLYLSLVARILPFDSSAILPDLSTLAVPYKENPYSTARIKRTVHFNTKECRTLKKYGLSDSDIDHLKQYRKSKERDQEIARMVLCKTDPALYQFLFPADRISRENLQALLLDPMDSPKLHALYEKIKASRNPSSARQRKGKGTSIRDNFFTLSDIFSYQRLSKQPEINQLISLLKIDVCPYCNCSLIRPMDGYRHAELDHYISKSAYPEFSVSLLNLIPACPTCNHVKSDSDDPIFYPYSESLKEENCFETRVQNGVSYLVGEPGHEDDFKICIRHSDSDEKINNAWGSVFKLNEVYNHQRNYVLSMFYQRTVFSKPYLDSLCASLYKINPTSSNPSEEPVSTEDIKRSLYLRSIQPSDYLSTPLGRLTHDIDQEIERLLKDAEIEYQSSKQQ